MDLVQATVQVNVITFAMVKDMDLGKESVTVREMKIVLVTVNKMVIVKESAMDNVMVDKIKTNMKKAIVIESVILMAGAEESRLY
jgi:hypothetical protein